MTSVSATQVPPDRELRALTRLTRVLDGGVDPLLGLIAPGVGDVIATLLGGSLVTSAVRRRLPVVVIARMILNLTVDALIGAIPLVGDLFDFGFKANRKNLALLTERRVDRRATKGDWAVLVGAVSLLIVVLVGVVYGTVRLAAYLLG